MRVCGAMVVVCVKWWCVWSSASHTSSLLTHHCNSTQIVMMCEAAVVCEASGDTVCVGVFVCGCGDVVIWYAITSRGF